MAFLLIPVLISGYQERTPDPLPVEPTNPVPIIVGLLIVLILVALIVILVRYRIKRRNRKSMMPCKYSETISTKCSLDDFIHWNNNCAALSEAKSEFEPLEMKGVLQCVSSRGQSVFMLPEIRPGVMSKKAQCSVLTVKPAELQ